MNENNEFRNKLMINSATSVSLGNISWFGLDTKLVGRIKALLEENEELKQETEKLTQLWLDSQQKRRKAIEIYENRNSIKYKNKRFMEDKYTSDLMYEALQGSDKE